MMTLIIEMCVLVLLWMNLHFYDLVFLIFTIYIKKVKENTETHFYKITPLPVCTFIFDIQNSVC